MNKVYIVTKKPELGARIAKLCGDADTYTTLTTSVDLFGGENTSVLSEYSLFFIDAIFKKPTQPEGAVLAHKLNRRGLKTYILVDDRYTIPWVITSEDQAQYVLVKDDTLDARIRDILAETFINP